MLHNYLPRLWVCSRILIVLTLTSSVFTASGQEILELIEKNEGNFYEIQAEAEKYFKENGTGKGSGYKLYKRWEHFASMKMEDDGTLISPLTSYNEFRAFKNKRAAKGVELGKASTGNWQSLGPYSWTKTSSWSPGLGRITAIAVEETNQQLIYACSPGGGIWKSTDAGQSWVPQGDDLDNMSIWSAAIDPVNNDVAYHGNSSGKVLKTTDGGENWLPTGDQVFGTPKGILINPNNTSEVMAVSSSGIFRSTNAGASWVRVSTTSTEDIAYKPGSTTIVYATGGTFQKSTDGGASWSAVGTGFVSTERMKLEVTPANANYVYLIQKQGSGFGRIYRSTNEGVNFTVMSDINSGADNYLGSQASRDMAIAVSTTNANMVHIGGLDYYRSTDGGANFTKLAGWSNASDPSYVHADIEVFEYYNGTLYCGSDGGIFRSTDNGDNMVDLTVNGLTVSQFYRLGGSATDPGMVVSGAQDNGTLIMSGSDDFLVWLGADGMEAFIDHQNANNVYGTSQNGTLYKSTNGGNSYSGLSEPEEDGNWVTPFENDPINSNIIYAGYNDVYKHTSGGVGGSWQNITTTIDLGGYADEIAIAPSNNNYIYIANNSNVWRTKNGQATTPSWTLVNGFSGNVNYIIVDPNDPEHVAIAASSSRVYESTNAGDSWTDIRDNLPGVGAECVLFDNSPLNGLYVGMGVGVYYRNDTTSEWLPFMEGLPNVEVTELEIQYSVGKIRASTYGRGLYESDVFGDVIDASITSTGATTICMGSTVDLVASTGTNYTYQWKRNGAAISGATGGTLNVNEGGSYSVVVDDGDASGESQPITVTILLENSPEADEVVNCGPGDVQLTALANDGGSLEWFDAASNGSSLGTGNSIVQTVNSSGSFYVQEYIDPIQYVGAVDSAMGSGGFHAGGFYLVFDADKAFVLKSVLVYADGAGDRTFELRDSEGTIITSKTVSVPDGASRVQLDLSVPTGDGLQIGAATGANLYRNNEGVLFPYQIGGFININGSTASAPTSYYYYLYDWEVEETGFSGCTSARTEVAVEIIDLPALPNADDQAICEPGGEVELTAVGTGGQLEWFDVASGGSVIETGEVLTVNVNSTTMYYVQESSINAPQFGGAVSPASVGAGGYHQGGFYLSFDAYEPFVIKSILVDAEGVLDRTFELFDAADNVLETKTVSVPDGLSRVTLNFSVPQGTGLQLGAAAGAQLFRNNSGVAFPYQLGTLGQITTSSAGADYYYYCYDWEIQEEGVLCVGPRKEVVAEVGVCTGVETDALASSGFYPNPTTGVLHMELPSEWDVEAVRVVNETGLLMLEHAGRLTSVDFSSFEAGVYFVEIQAKQQYSVKRIVVNPNE